MISNFKFMNENFQLNENQPSNSEMPVGGRGVEVWINLACRSPERRR